MPRFVSTINWQDSSVMPSGSGCYLVALRTINEKIITMQAIFDNGTWSTFDINGDRMWLSKVDLWAEMPVVDDANVGVRNVGIIENQTNIISF